VLYVTFQLDADRYAIEATRLAEILPLVTLKAVPQARRGTAGLLNYRGRVLPVIDLPLLALGRPAAVRLSTRVLVVAGARDAGPALGLVAEDATRLIRLETSAFTAGTSTGATYLGPVAIDDAGQLIQRVNVDALIAEAMPEQALEERLS
jgi:chemotaxis-related protein WspB